MRVSYARVLEQKEYFAREFTCQIATLRSGK